MGDREDPLGGRAEAELRRLAYRDDLTELPNRIAMADRIEASVARSRREASCTALVFVDVDGMGRVNATLGHTAGNELLQLIAARLGDQVGLHVTVGRHGGDEFLLLLDDLPGDPAAARAAVHAFGERVASSFRRPFTVERSTFEISGSAGASVFGVDADSHHALFEHADQALFHAKRRGGGQLVIFDQPVQHSLLELEATQRARRGLARAEFELFYQPVVAIADEHSLVGLEALVRWRDPDRGLLAPEKFLPFIERSPLVEALGDWVFSDICRQLAEWGGRGFAPRVSFNVPARQLRSPSFAEFVVVTAYRHGVDPACVSAEITESSPISLDEVLPTLTRLRDAGFSLSLDDFGTGYSSLSRLRTLPFTVLKTDRSFLAGVPGDPIAEELLRGMIVLGATLGLDVIVEGVETSEQERELLRLGARVAQGYHLGVPAPAAEIEARWSCDDAAVAGIGGAAASGSGGAPVAEPPLTLAVGRSRSSRAARRTPPPQP